MVVLMQSCRIHRARMPCVGVSFLVLASAALAGNADPERGRSVSPVSVTVHEDVRHRARLNSEADAIHGEPPQSAETLLGEPLPLSDAETWAYQEAGGSGRELPCLPTAEDDARGTTQAPDCRAYYTCIDDCAEQYVDDYSFCFDSFATAPRALDLCIELADELVETCLDKCGPRPRGC